MTDPDDLDLDAALELVVAQTRVDRYRWLASDSNPDAPAWRRWLLDRAAEYAGPPPAGPAAVVVHYTDPDAPRPCRGCPG